MAGETYGFGLPAEQEDFGQRNARFLEVWPHLRAAIELVGQPRFFRPAESADAKTKAKAAAQKLVYTMGQVAIEDFMEIALVCGNGYGAAGFKLLRTMYEMTITQLYISRHPEEADAFKNYDSVHQRKIFTVAKQAGIRLSESTVAFRQQTEEEYRSIKDQYRDVVCDECGTEDILRSWTRKNLSDLAREVDFPQSALWLNYLPTLYVHATPMRLRSRVMETADEIVVTSGPQRALADQALFGAHVCLILTLTELNGYFRLDLDEGEMERDFIYAWPTRIVKAGSA